jgi:pyruvate/2-oxoglutarate dehydrogenase complex dihydrolipoamide acyltransferase (E2) component
MNDEPDGRTIRADDPRLSEWIDGRLPAGAASLTYLPFLIAALARVLEDYPQCNAWFDAERNVVVRHRPLHAGVATQTPDGLKVAVVRHAEARSLWELAEEIKRVSETARSGKDMLTVTYYGCLSDKPVTEYLTVLHEGYAGRAAFTSLKR